MTYPWAVPLGLILASCGWWEGFAGENSPLLPVRMMFNVRRRMIDGTRYFVYLWVTVFKVLILKFPLLGDKMNLTVRLGKLFYENSIGVPALLPCSVLPRQSRGTLRKLCT